MTSIKNKWINMPLTIKVSVAYAFCSILQKGISFITLPLFTRLLTTEQYGQLTIYQSWHGILSILITLNLAYGSFSTAMTKYEDDRDGYISAVEGMCLALSAVFLIVYLPFRNIWNQLFELPTTIMCIMVAETLCMTAVQLWSGKKRFEFRYKEVISITLLISILSPILAFFMIINTDEKGYARIIGYALVSIVIGGVIFAQGIYKGRKTIDKEYWKYGLGFNIPLLVYYLSQVIFNQSDRIMISHMIGKDKAAIYGVAYSLATMLTFVINAINNSYVPWFYGSIKNGRTKDNKAVSVGIVALMALLLSAVIWFAPEIIMVMAGSKYTDAIYVVPPVATSLLLLFYSQLFINVEFYYEEKKSLVYASVFAALANISLNWIFIKKYGFIAAAYTTLLSYLIFAIMNCLAMRKTLRKKELEDDAYEYKSLIALMTVFGISTIAGALLYNQLIVRMTVATLIVVIIVLKRSSLMLLYKSIKGESTGAEENEVINNEQ